MSSSDSDDDFLSADEGSDNDQLSYDCKNEEKLTLSKEEKDSDLSGKVPDLPKKVTSLTERVADVEESVPDVKEKVPDVEERVPDVEERVPDVEERVPDVEERVPDVEEKVPDVEEGVPDVEEKVPDVEEKVPDVEEGVPDVKERVPGVKERVPDVEERVPDVKERVPDVKERVPDVKERVNVEENVPDMQEKVNDIKLEKKSGPENVGKSNSPIINDKIDSSNSSGQLEQVKNKLSEEENRCGAYISDKNVNELELEEKKEDNLENESIYKNEKLDKTKDEDESSYIVPDSNDQSSTTEKSSTDKMVKDSLPTSNITDIYCLNPNDDVNSVKKPKRVSKIGAKKPREKLGERKKLGTKIARPLDSVSCDDRREPQEPNNQPQRKESFGSWEKINSIDGAADAKSQDDASGWSSGWGDWGSSLVSAASTLKQEVSKGVGSVVELVEDGINIPSPEELAKEQVERDRWINRLTEENSEDSIVTPSPPSETAGFGLNLGGFTSLVSGVSGVGSKVMMGGLDTLELIGRKTMTVLQDTDPNIRYKKEQFLAKVNKPNLSSVLREAREFAESNPSPSDSNSPSSPSRRGSHRITYQQLWDNSTGPAHLEALALIARQSSANTKELLDSLPTGSRQKADSLNRKLRELSELEEENLAEGAVFSEQVTATIKLLKLPLNADNIAQCWTDLSTLSSQYIKGSEVLRDTVALDASTVEANLLGSCVSLVERIVSVAHKAAEICLSDIAAVNALELAINYKELTVLGGSHLDCCTDTVCTGLSSTEQYEKLSPLITNIYMQVCEGTSCLQQSLVHLCTTLQLVQAQQIKDSL